VQNTTVKHVTGFHKDTARWLNHKVLRNGGENEVSIQGLGGLLREFGPWPSGNRRT
jgi:hypothetical protein